MDMVCPTIGVILYYIIIFGGAHLRHIISDWGHTFPGGDIIIFAGAYLTSILIVSLYCNFKIFHMWGLNKYPIHDTKEQVKWKAVEENMVK